MTTKKFLTTMEHNSVRPINRGFIEVSDDGWVTDEDGDKTPIEDFGMYILSPDKPFPKTGSKELFQMFLDLIED